MILHYNLILQETRKIFILFYITLKFQQLSRQWYLSVFITCLSFKTLSIVRNEAGAFPMPILARSSGPLPSRIFNMTANFPGQNWKNCSVKPELKEVCPSGYCSVKQQICNRLKIKSNCSSSNISLMIVILRVENWPCKSQEQLLSDAGEVQICSHAPYLGAKQPHKTGVYF